VPFAALLEDGEPARRLLDRFAIGYLATGRSLLDIDRAAAPPAEPPVVIGDPDYDFDKPGEPPVPPPAPVKGFPAFYFERLPGTADEAWRVAQLVAGRRVTGKKANEAALRACRSPALLHIASHGYYVRPFAKGIHVIGNWRELGAQFRGEALGRAGSAFVRSGIVLAGVNAWSANRSLPDEVGDGLLTAAEVARIALEGTELVVLSACSGALGDVTPGNGVSGLLHGFHVAGARATVASLWRIPDEITERLMRGFYERLLEGQTRIEALRRAQQELSGTHPAWQWGSYVSYGSPGAIAYRPATGTARSD
jgi:CHAT domain-containing protein